MASSQSNTIYRPHIPATPFKAVLQNTPGLGSALWVVAAAGAVTMEGEAIAIGPELYVPGLILWALTVAYKAYKASRRATEVST